MHTSSMAADLVANWALLQLCPLLIYNSDEVVVGHRVALHPAVLRAKKLGTNLLCCPAVGRLIAKVFRDRIPARGLQIATDSPSIAPELKAMLFWGIYESAEARFVDEYLRRDLDVVELGGSIGFISACIRRRLAPSQRLVCVEANAALLPIIEKTLALNELDRGVTVVHGAIDYWTEGSLVRLAFTRWHVETRLADLGSEVTKNECVVPRITLSALLKEHNIGDYVLVSDIEGAEKGLLVRDRQALARCRQILIELHAGTVQGRTFGPDDLIADCLQMGFALRDRYGSVCALDRP